MAKQVVTDEQLERFYYLCLEYCEAQMLPVLVDRHKSRGKNYLDYEPEEYYGNILDCARRVKTMLLAGCAPDDPGLVDAVRDGANYFLLQGLKLQHDSGPENL